MRWDGGMQPDRIEASANYAFELRGNQETWSRTTHANSHWCEGKAPVWRGRKEGRRERCERVKTGGRGEPFIWGDLACHVRCVSFGGPSFEPDAMSDTSPVHDDPDLPQNVAPRLGIPGKPDFFASVLRFIRTSAPGFPLDPVIFQSIILSVMAGNKHVLLRAKDEDISIVQNLAALVSNAILVCS